MNELVVGNIELEYVEPLYACPYCGENRLYWIEPQDGTIHCMTCGSSYVVEEE